MRLVTSRAKSDPKRVVFAEADQLNVLKAAQIAHDEGIAIPMSCWGTKKRFGN